MGRFCPVLGAAIAVLGLTVASSAGATPFLSAIASEGGTFGGCFPTGGGFTSTGVPVSSQIICSDAHGAGSALAIASIGNLGAKADALEIGFSNLSFGGATVYSDTVVFSGPGADPIPVRINLYFGGSINSTPGATANALAHATIYSTVVGQAFVAVIGGVQDCTGTTFAGLGACGSLYNDTLQSSFVLVPLNFPVLVVLDLQANAGAGDLGASATSSFSNTFGFITGAPLFDLPAGFTANSPTSFIVNNQFLPPAPPPATVPEPSSGLLVLSALGLLAMSRRRRTAASNQNS